VRRARPERALEGALAAAVAAAPGEVVLAAVSGGPDSGALAALLARHVAGRGARLVLGHVNHAVRATADRDEAVVLALGAALGARVLTRRLPPGPAAEARLREARYAALAGLARAAGASRVFTAHHAEDQTETVLLALFRGSGPQGIAGMAPDRSIARGLRLVRPLLEVPKARLVAYCAERGLPYALDPTNAESGYRRNALRGALETLRESFPGLDASVARFAAIARAERAGAGRAALRRELRGGLEAALGDLRDIGLERVDAVARAVERGRQGRHFVREDVEVIVRRSR
jgi:tRNA(Ile)-lysidine synthase